MTRIALTLASCRSWLRPRQKTQGAVFAVLGQERWPFPSCRLFTCRLCRCRSYHGAPFRGSTLIWHTLH